VKKEQGNVLDIREVDISNFRFRLINLKKPAEKDFGINWKDLDIMVHKLEGKKLSIAGGYIQGEATDLAFTEKSGYDVSHMSGKVKVGHQETVIDDMKIIDNYSDLNFKQFKMAFEEERQFFDFLHRVRLTADMEESTLNFESLAYYGKALRDRNMVMKIHDCSVDGPVSDMDVSLNFDELNSGIEGLLKGSMSGLPKVADFRLDFTARNLNFTSKGIEQVMRGWAPRSKAAISKFAPDEELTFNGTISGLLDQLEINGDITTTDAGSLTADVGFDHLVTKGEPMRLGGNVATDNLDLGKLLNVNKLGPTTLCAPRLRRHWVQEICRCG
jgi:hypothetical protein